MSNTTHTGSAHKPAGWFEYILTYYRGWFAVFFLLPVSVMYSAWLKIRNRIIFHLRSAPGKHAQKVDYVRGQVLKWKREGAKEKLTTGRSGWFTMSDSVPKYKKTHRKIFLPLQDILELDVERKIVRVEPLVSMGQLTSSLNPMGWTLPVVPELDDLTVGGLIMGFGVETSSHKYGLFQFICESFEIVTAEGKLMKCSRQENSDLFYSIPWSHGTLGFLVAVELRIIPARPYVQLQYIPVFSKEEMAEVFEKACRNTENDFVEGLVYSNDTAVIMLGKMTGKKGKDGKYNPIGNYYKPWFYKHVEKFLRAKKTAVEYIPLRHYYHRHTRSLFWEMEEIIPFGNRPLFRYMAGWAIPPKISLMKFTETETTRRLREKYHIVQDMLVPMYYLKESLEYFHNHYNLYPLWISPMSIYGNEKKAGFVHPFSLPDGGTDPLYVDIGAYGTPKMPDFDADTALKDLEKFVIAHHGYQALYARSLMSREEFRKMFDHSLYDELRETLPFCEQAFDEVYDKVSHKARVSSVEFRKGKKLKTEVPEKYSDAKID